MRSQSPTAVRFRIAVDGRPSSRSNTVVPKVLWKLQTRSIADILNLATFCSLREHINLVNSVIWGIVRNSNFGWSLCNDVRLKCCSEAFLDLPDYREFSREMQTYDPVYWNSIENGHTVWSVQHSTQKSEQASESEVQTEWKQQM